MDAALSVDLEVERFWVTSPTTRFVIGLGDRSEKPI
jgi:hypothetical protein